MGEFVLARICLNGELVSGLIGSDCVIVREGRTYLVESTHTRSEKGNGRRKRKRRNEQVIVVLLDTVKCVFRRDQW